VELENTMISLSRQCDLLGMSRSSFYYRSRRDNTYNDFLMRLIDDQYTQRPTFGVEKMRDWLRNQGHWVNEKRVRRLMRLMGLEAVYPKPRISMDGRGRLYDNIFVERLWRTVKYDEVYLNDYISVPVARNGLGNYFEFYNTERSHASLDGKIPYDVYFGISMARNTGFGQRV